MDVNQEVSDVVNRTGPEQIELLRKVHEETLHQILLRTYPDADAKRHAKLELKRREMSWLKESLELARRNYKLAWWILALSVLSILVAVVLHFF